MDVDPSTTFSSHNLGGLSSLLGYNDFSPIVKMGFESVDFFKMITTLCTEIKLLYELDECPTDIDCLDKDNVKAFLYELSAFLTELDCGVSDLLQGPLEERFSSMSRRQCLVSFLLLELKAARLSAQAQLRKPQNVEDSPIALNVGTILHIFHVPLMKKGDECDLVARIGVEADRRLQALPLRPKPLFKTEMNEHNWAAVDTLCHQMTGDVRARNLLLLKRIDVTVNSFLWTDRVRRMEKEIRTLFSTRRQLMAKVIPLDVVRLLACSDTHLRVEQASCSRLRANTKSKVHPLANAEPPKDRGGRTNEISAPVRETFHMQQQNREGGAGRGYRGHGRGGGGSRQYGQRYDSTGGGGQQFSAEQQARQEWRHRAEEGYRNNGGNRGFRGGRGDGYHRGGGRGGRGGW